MPSNKNGKADGIEKEKRQENKERSGLQHGEEDVAGEEIPAHSPHPLKQKQPAGMPAGCYELPVRQVRQGSTSPG
jgi:hypothetical protein